jgi:PGF-pre-PGF domain-containing protein
VGTPNEVNDAGNYVYANISKFGSIFAPMAKKGVDNCRNLITANENYILINNLTGNQSNGICIDIQADNITLDCNGTLNNLTGLYPNSTGIRNPGYNNITIINCTIYNYTEGLRATHSSNSNYSFNTFINNTNDFVALGHSYNSTATELLFGDANLSFAYESEFKINSTNYSGSFGTYQNPVDSFVNIKGIAPFIGQNVSVDSDTRIQSLDYTADGGYIALVSFPSYPLLQTQLLKMNEYGTQEWNKTVANYSRSVHLTADGGYAFVSTTSDGIDNNVTLYKTDRYGNEEWNKSYDNGLNESVSSMQTTSDGGYVIAGQSGSKVLVIKTNSSGDIEWNNSYTDVVSTNDVVETSDGGYALCGSNGSANDGMCGGHMGTTNMWALKTNSTGGEEWNVTYPSANTIDGCNSLAQINDGGYLLAGTAGYCDLFMGAVVHYGEIKKINSTGQLQGTHEYYSSYGYDAEIYKIKAIEDPSYAAAASGYVYHWYGTSYMDAFVAKMFSSGSGGTQRLAPYSHATDFVITADKGYAVAEWGSYPFDYVRIEKRDPDLSNSIYGSADGWMFVNMSYDESKLNISEYTVNVYNHEAGMWYSPASFSSSVYGTNIGSNYAYVNLTSFTYNPAYRDYMYAPLENTDPCDLYGPYTLTTDLLCPSGMTIHTSGKLNTDGWDVIVYNGVEIEGYLNATGDSILDFTDSPSEVYNGGALGSNDWSGDMYVNFLTIDYGAEFNATRGTVYVSNSIELDGAFNYNGGSMDFDGTNAKFDKAYNISLSPVSTPPGDVGTLKNIGYYVDVDNTTADGGFGGSYFNITYSDGDASNETNLSMWKYNGTDWTQDGIYETGVNDSENYVWANISSFSIFAPMEQQPPITFTNMSTNNTNHNVSARYSSRVTSPNTLSKCRIEHNNSGTFVNTSLNSISGTSSWCNFTLRNNNSNNVNVAWYVWANDSTGNWTRSAMQSFLTTNTVPILVSVSSNVTNITEGTAVRLSSSGASDYNQDNLRLECGYSNGAVDACAGTYGSGTRNCALSWPYDDNENHTLYCRVNDRYGVSTPDFELNITGYTPHFRISVQSPSNNSYYNTADMWFNISMNKNASTCLVSIDENTNTTMDNSGPITWYNYTIGFSESDHNVTFWCSRYDGYENDSRTIYFAVDLTQPFINITQPLNLTTITSSTTNVHAIVNEFASACTAEFDSLTNVSMTNSSGDWNAIGTLANGAHNAIVYCSDRADNWNRSDTVQFSVLVTQAAKGGGGRGLSGLQPNITVTEIIDKAGFWVYMDNLMANINYNFPSLWPDDLRITSMTLDSDVYDETFTARVTDSTSLTAPTGNVYQYFEFDLSGLNATPTEVDFAFRTRIDWLESSGAHVQNMKLYAHDGITWHELDTIVDYSNGTYVLFNSTDSALYSTYAIAESGAQFGEVTFTHVIYAIEKYYNGEIGFIDVLDTVSEYYMQNK